MSNEFDDAEMMPCDLCGEFWPGDEMTELDDGRLCCPECLDEIDSVDEREQ